FWNFNGVAGVQAPQNRNSLLSESLASELGASAGDSVLLRLEKPSEIPVESLHGRKEDPGRTIRLSASGVLNGESLGEFSLQPQQGSVRAVFVSLSMLQKELEQDGKVNTILVAGGSVNPSLHTLVNERSTLEDLGLNIRNINPQSISLETSSKIINDYVATAANKAATELSLKTVPVLSYLANSISTDKRSIPYSLVTALDDETLATLANPSQQVLPHPPI